MLRCDQCAHQPPVLKFMKEPSTGIGYMVRMTLPWGNNIKQNSVSKQNSVAHAELLVSVWWLFLDTRQRLRVITSLSLDTPLQFYRMQPYFKCHTYQNNKQVTHRELWKQAHNMNPDPIWQGRGWPWYLFHSQKLPLVGICDGVTTSSLLHYIL